MSTQKPKIREQTPATIHDVSKKAGVSIMSVSLAFRDGSRVSDKTRKKILAAAKELNYVPNRIAQGLRTGKSHFIGFIVHDITNPFHALILRESEKSFSKSGMEVLMGCSDWDVRHERRLVEKMIRMRVRGVMVCLCEEGEESLDLLRDAGIPFLAIDSVPEAYDGPAVVNDLDQCGRLMARHFHEIGVRRPGFVNANAARSNCNFSRAIFGAFRDELARCGLAMDPRNYIEGGLTLASGEEAYRRLKERRFNADGLFCINDVSAIGVMNAAEADGIVVGRDLALAGVDDLDFSRVRRIGLTSIRQPYEQIAEHAATLLTDMIRGRNKKNRRVSLPQELIVRESTANFGSNIEKIRKF